MQEKWREVYSPEQLKKLQAVELKNLKVLDDVCKKIGVEFFVYGGTLIGAVRHKGFVPWDDDLDIALSRSDYMKFIRQAPALLPEEYYLQTPYTDKKTPFLYSKLRLKNTKYTEYIHHKLNIEQGIYVDIYPIDHIPDDDKAFLHQYDRFQKLARWYGFRQCPFPSTEGKSLVRRIKNAARFLLSYSLKMIPQRFFVKKMDSIMTKYNHIPTKRTGNLSYFDPTNLFFDPFPLVQGEFEGVAVHLPNHWDEHLASRYGNYMELPPEEKRLGHRPYLLDFGKYE